MPSPVLTIAKTFPEWDSDPSDKNRTRLVRDVRVVLRGTYAEGKNAAECARAVFERRRDDPDDDEKRPDFDGLPAQDRAAYANLVGRTTSEAAKLGITPAPSGGGIPVGRRT
jgi:hypothetical protein